MTPEGSAQSRESLLEGMIELSRSQALGVYSAVCVFASALYVVSLRKRFVPAITGFTLLYSADTDSRSRVAAAGHLITD